jgi:hypothetical protein
MSLVETFGDAISSLRTDPGSVPAKPSELEIAHTLFDKLTEKYADTSSKETEAPIEDALESSGLSFKQLLKKAIAVTILVLFFSFPMIRDLIQKYTNNSYITYAVIFAVSLVAAFLIVKKL